MTNASVPTDLIRDITERYATEGYLPAGADRLPSGLGSQSGVDLIFQRGDQVVLVQFKRTTASVSLNQSSQLSQLARDVKAFPNVRLDVVHVPDSMDTLPDRALIISRADAAAAIARRSANLRDQEAALLLAASAAEGALGLLLRDRSVQIKGVPRLADLAVTAWSEGLMTKDQWDRLQQAIDRRNAVAHGLLPGAATIQGDVKTLADLARTFANPDFQSGLDLVDWFFERYKDPADGVPHDSRGGGYQYVNGGPFDAEDVLANQFPTVSEEIRGIAVEQIEAYGAEWVRREEY